MKNPPESYQQPAVDLLGGLNVIARDVQAGTYRNEYDFEVALQKLLYATHDSHIVLDGGALSVFKFGSPVRIVSVSADGIAVPRVYVLGEYNGSVVVPVS